MKVLYQSLNYRPERIERRYLHIDLHTDRPIVDECGGPHNFIMRSYELLEKDYSRYSQAIAEAQQRKYLFPFSVNLRVNPS